MALYFKTLKEKAEKVRRRLMQLEAFDINRKVFRERDFVFLPVLKKASVKEGVFVGKNSPKIELKPRSLRESLEGKLSPKELKLLPSAFDVIGDIAVLDIPDALSGRVKVIANALLKTFRSIKVVAVKVAPVSSKFRVRGLRVVAGENRTVTVHKEYDCLYKLDVASAYFSPRLGTERMRVAEKVKHCERVLVLFAGVGPYAVLIAKKRNPSEVVAVELNPSAVEFMRENVKVNKVLVDIVLGDVRVVVPNLGKFDRIIMPLPKDAGNFLDIALPALSKNGVIHFYEFSGSPEESAKNVKMLCKRLGYKIKVLDSVICGNYSPGIHRICVDFKVV